MPTISLTAEAAPARARAELVAPSPFSFDAELMHKQKKMSSRGDDCVPLFFGMDVCPNVEEYFSLGTTPSLMSLNQTPGRSGISLSCSRTKHYLNGDIKIRD